MSKGKNKLYVWEGVLTDYTSGMAVALAPTLKEALATFPDYVAKELSQETPCIYHVDRRNPVSHYVYGGG